MNLTKSSSFQKSLLDFVLIQKLYYGIFFVLNSDFPTSMFLPQTNPWFPFNFPIIIFSDRKELLRSVTSSKALWNLKRKKQVHKKYHCKLLRNNFFCYKVFLEYCVLGGPQISPSHLCRDLSHPSLSPLPPKSLSWLHVCSFIEQRNSAHQNFYSQPALPKPSSVKKRASFVPAYFFLFLHIYIFYNFIKIYTTKFILLKCTIQ